MPRVVVLVIGALTVTCENEEQGRAWAARYRRPDDLMLENPHEFNAVLDERLSRHHLIRN